jgi:hypothetical protein
MDYSMIDALATGRHGLVTLDELLDAGASSSSVRRMIAAGRLVRVHDGVYRCAGAPVTTEQRLLAACLAAGPGSAVSHRAAANLFGLRVPGEIPIEITVPRATSPDLDDVVVHRLEDLEPRWVTSIDGIHVTLPARIAVDAGAVLSIGPVSRLFDQITGRRLATYHGIRDALDAVARKGRAGVGIARRLLAERSGEPEADSVLHARLATLMRNHGLPVPEFEYTITGHHGEFVARVDCAYPDLRYAMEVDGYESHVAPQAFAHDRVRQNDVVDLGWTVHRFTWDMVVRQPRRTAERIRRARRRLLGTLKSA